MTALPHPIQSFLESTNRGDAEAVISCFAPDAILSDWGRTFHGQAGVAEWDKTDNTGVRSHIEALNATTAGDRHAVTVRVSGDGFNGTGEMFFTLAGDRIARLEIE